MTVPFYLAASVAISQNGGPFERWSPAPLLERSAVDPFLTASPFVLIGHGRWRMWYVSATEWRNTESGPRHYYHIRYAESADGFAWHREGHVAVDYANEDEHAFARPWVVHDDDRYRMWFAVRGERYRIALAESDDGLTWTRGNELGLTPGAEAWESEMVEYPCVFDWDGRRFMLYNGNDYGRSGVGLAVLDALDRRRIRVVTRLSFSPWSAPFRHLAETAATLSFTPIDDHLRRASSASRSTAAVESGGRCSRR